MTSKDNIKMTCHPTHYEFKIYKNTVVKECNQ